jgi:hypothetical protein
MKSIYVALSSLLLITFSDAKEIPCDLDPLLSVPANWEMTPDSFEEKYTQDKNRNFVWLNSDRTRAKLSRKLYGNVVINLTAFGGKVPVQEAIIDFMDGKLNLVTLSIYNRGDAESITEADFTERFTTSGKAVGETLGTAPRRKDAKPGSGLLTAGYSWYSAKTGVALLEHNEKAMDGGDREFLRLRMARPGAKGSLATSLTHSRGGAAVRQGDLPDNLKKSDNGDIFISTLPMVDQGDKGYCVVATVQRVFEYYGIGADMHQIAQIAEADPQRGTSTLTMAKELDKIDYRFRTRLDTIGMADGGGRLTSVEVKKGEYYVGDPVDERKFLKEIRSHIDSGLPLLWSLELGRFPEKPQLNPQASGGHMRLIIGYNDEENEIIFSDSWGAGHEMKRIKMSHAYAATRGLFVLKPTSH